MEVSSWEGGSSPAAAAATATATAARKEESKLVQSPKAIPSKRRAGTPHSHQARPASDGGREGRKERDGREREREACMPMQWDAIHATSWCVGSRPRMPWGGW